MINPEDYAIKTIRDKDKRIAELETALTEIRYIADGAIKIQPIYAIADSALSEGGADDIRV